MKKHKITAIVFVVAAILLSDVMCAHVAYEYCNMLWGIQYAGYSAPAGVAFLLAIPYAVGILLCCIFGWVFWRKVKL